MKNPSQQTGYFAIPYFTAGAMYGFVQGLAAGAMKVKADALIGSPWFPTVSELPFIEVNQWADSISLDDITYVDLSDFTRANAFVSLESEDKKFWDGISLPIDVDRVVDLVRATDPGKDDQHVKHLFDQRLEKWKDDTMFESSMTKLILHPEYQKIIGMGEKVIGLLLNELVREPQWLFHALEAVTGENPAPPSAAGDLEALTAYWLAWGSANGFISRKKAPTGVSGTRVNWVPAA